MSLALPSRGQHAATTVIARLRTQLRQAEEGNERLVNDSERREAEIYEALLRGCQDSMRIAQLTAERDALLAANKELRHKTIRAQAEQERLRRAVVNARPRITVAVQALDRPYVSAVQLPYPVPVGQSTANDETQELPIVEQPEPWPVYAMPVTA